MNFRIQNSRFKILLLTVFAVLMVAGTASAQLTVTANHDHITVDFFYHGNSVSVRGVSDSGTDLVIKVSSPDGHQSLRQKGKVAGLLWMNVGKLTFEHVPSVYFLQSTKNLAEILNNDELKKYVLGYPALELHTEVSPVLGDVEKNKWFDEFVKMKEASKVYSTASGKISTTTKDGLQEYYVLMDWPYQAPPGEYTVSVYAVRNNKVVDQAESKVTVEQIGVVKYLATMAKSKAAAYGIVSILAALGAGFGVGLIFRKGGGGH